MPRGATESVPRMSRGGCAARIAAIVVFAIALTVVAVTLELREQSRQFRAQHTLHQVACALLQYHDSYDRFPPAFVDGDSDMPAHSWRVLLLPFLGADGGMYSDYDLSEPWNGPNNSRLQTELPHLYRTDNCDVALGLTSVVAIVGNDTVMRGNRSASCDEIVDGTDSTIMLAVLRHAEIPWTAPIDVNIESPDFSAADIEAVAFCSTRTLLLRENISVDEFRAPTTISGGDSFGVIAKGPRW